MGVGVYEAGTVLFDILGNLFSCFCMALHSLAVARKEQQSHKVFAIPQLLKTTKMKATSKAAAQAKTQTVVNNAAVAATSPEVVEVVETPLEQIAGEIDLTEKAPKAAPKAKAAKAEPTAEELAEKAAQEAEAAKAKAENEAALAAAEEVLLAAAEKLEAAKAEHNAANEAFKAAKRACGHSGTGIASPRIEGKGVIECILDLWKAGHSRPEIIKMGYNKSTVQRQVGEYLKAQKEGAVEVGAAGADEAGI